RGRDAGGGCGESGVAHRPLPLRYARSRAGRLTLLEVVAKRAGDVGKLQLHPAVAYVARVDAQLDLTSGRQPAEEVAPVAARNRGQLAIRVAATFGRRPLP